MLLAIIIGFTAILTGLLIVLRSRRAMQYAGLARLIERLPAPNSTLAAIGNRPVPAFGSLLARSPDFLPLAVLTEVRSQVEALAESERNYIPTHKKGATVAYETLITQAPALVALYQSPMLIDFISRLVGVNVRPTPLHDQSSLSVLRYERPGDHIGWHYDHNFYRGRHFTVLLPVVNQGSDADGLSHARLIARLDGREIEIATPPNALVVFEGARVSHRVVPIIDNERRLVVSMTYCTDSRANWAQAVARRVKDIAFFGPRALWT